MRGCLSVVSGWSNDLLIFSHILSQQAYKKSQSSIPFWDLQTKRQAIHMENKILEEKAQLQRVSCLYGTSEI